MRYKDQVYGIPRDKKSINMNGMRKARNTAVEDELETF